MLYKVFIFPLEVLMDAIFHVAFLITDSYGLSIILLSIAVNTFSLPLYRLSDKWKKIDQKILLKMQPNIKSIKKYYRGKERYFYIKTLYRQNKYHPILSLKASAGFLFQIPIFLSAYHFINNLEALQNVEFLFLKNLAQPDSLLFGINLLPIIMTGINFLSAYNYEANLSKTEKFQLHILPILFLILLYNLSSGLVLYWTINNIFSLMKNTMNKFYFSKKKLNIDKNKLTNTQENKKRIHKKTPINFTIFSLSVINIFLLIAIVNPLTLYLSTDDFLIDPTEFRIFLITFFIIFFTICFFGYFICNPKYKKRFTALIFTLLCTLFTYSIIVKKNYGLMDHFTFHLPKTLIQTPFEISIEIILLMALFLLCVIVFSKFKKQIIYFEIMLSVAIVISTAMEMKTLFSNDFRFNQKKFFPQSIKKEQNNMLSFSTDTNILVILLDGFSGGYIDTIFKKAPDIFKDYTGFIWYPNTLTTSTATWSSIAAMLGGHKYTVESINQRNSKSLHDELSNAYNVLPSNFIPNGYKVSYFNPVFSPNLDKNIYVSKTQTYEEYFKKRKNLPHQWAQVTDDSKVLLMLSLFKAVPLFSRKLIYDNGRWLGAYSSIHLVSRALSVWGFLDALENHSLIQEQYKTLKFVHLNCPHFPHILDNECNINPKVASYSGDATCALKKLGNFFSWMKKNNIYDNTKIILISDHGWWGLDSEKFQYNFRSMINPGYEKRFIPSFIQPLLMIKDINERKEFSKANIFLSNSDLPSIICSTLEENCPNIEIDPIKNKMINRKLIISNVLIPKNFNNEKKFSVLGQYSVEKSIFYPENWVKIK